MAKLEAQQKYNLEILSHAALYFQFIVAVLVASWVVVEFVKKTRWK